MARKDTSKNTLYSQTKSKEGVVRCAYCNLVLSKKKATKDHIVPRARGGKHGKHNLVLCCFACNATKADMTAEDFRAWLSSSIGSAWLSLGEAKPVVVAHRFASAPRWPKVRDDYEGEDR